MSIKRRCGRLAKKELKISEMLLLSVTSSPFSFKWRTPLFSPNDALDRSLINDRSLVVLSRCSFSFDLKYFLLLLRIKWVNMFLAGLKIDRACFRSLSVIRISLVISFVNPFSLDLSFNSFWYYYSVFVKNRHLKIDVYGKRQTASEVFDFTTLL
jgi:hypothetical protein